MKTCFVSMPFGKKTDPYTGITVDFDNIYRTLILPAISGTQYTSFRLDDIPDVSGRPLIEAVISSDIMIADLTMQNPNVLYELGMRHMAQRGLTIMICSSGTRLPSDIAYFRVIGYELDVDGNVTEKSKESFQQLLRYSIESNLEQTLTDSPVYQLFPDIQVILPERLNISESQNQVLKKPYRKITKGFKSSLNREQSIVNLKGIESEALTDPQTVDPIDFVTLLKNYRDNSAWKELTALAEAVPGDLKKSPEVQQLYALALNRLGEQEKAIAIMEQLIAATGGDAETYGILGRIYKDRYESSKASDNQDLANTFLGKAISSYRLGFEKQPNDYYTGVNVVNLLMQRQDAASLQELNTILPKVRELLKNKMNEGVPEYWDYATAVELSAIAKEWDEAEKQASLALQQKPFGWMIETTLHNLNLLQPVMNEEEKNRLNNVISILKQQNRLEEGHAYAYA